MPFSMPETNLEWLEDSIILLSPTGSVAYGTNTENSDEDYKGICVPPKEYFLGLESFNEYNNVGGKNFVNTKDDVDITIMHINKFVRSAMSGTPNDIELLFMEPEDYLVSSPRGTELVANRHLFLSKQIKNKFGGYANSQIKKLQVKKDNKTGRQELVKEFGYDTKFFLHGIRLLTSAIEILETGDFNTRRPNRDLLMDCRNGKYSLNEALEMIEHYDELLKKAYIKSELPNTPNYDKINNMLIEINESSLYLK